MEMDKEQFKKLMEQLEKLNENLGDIANELHSLDNTLDLIQTKMKPKAHFEV